WGPRGVWRRGPAELWRDGASSVRGSGGHRRSCRNEGGNAHSASAGRAGAAIDSRECATRKGVRICARPGELAALSGACEECVKDGRKAFALGGESAGGDTGGVGRGNYQRSARRANRVEVGQ